MTVAKMPPIHLRNEEKGEEVSGIDLALYKVGQRNDNRSLISGSLSRTAVLGCGPHEV